MNSLALASLLYLVSHFSSNSPLRPHIIHRFGEKAWMAGYSLVAMATLGWMIQAWRAAEVVWIASPEPWVYTLAAVLMPLACIFAVAGVTTPNPAGIAQGGVLERADAVQGVLKITRHPLPWGIALWATSHMLSNPDVASWWLFGSQLLLALAGALGQDLRKTRELGKPWDAYVAATSYLPFAAVASGRQSLPTDARFGLQVVGGLVLYGVLGLLHPWLFGAPAWLG